MGRRSRESAGGTGPGRAGARARAEKSGKRRDLVLEISGFGSLRLRGGARGEHPLARQLIVIISIPSFQVTPGQKSIFAFVSPAWDDFRVETWFFFHFSGIHFSE